MLHRVTEPEPEALHVLRVGGQERSGLAESRRIAESFLKTPLPVFVRRLLGAGRTPREIANRIEVRTNWWCDSQTDR